METEAIIIIISAITTAASFAIFAIPYLKNEKKKERFQDVIEKRRRDLREASRDGSQHKVKTEDTMSAKDDMAMFYKVKDMAGDMGEKVREQLLQAGNRDPSAPFKFMIAKAVIPIFLCLLVIMFSSASEKEISNGVQMILFLIAAGFGYKLPDIMVQNQILKRQEEINLSFADALDMMLICVQGGIGLEQTVDRVAKEMTEASPILAEELGILSAEMAMLNDRRQALQDFAKRVGSGAAKSFATSLVQAEQYGTSVSQAMRVMSDELRDMRMAAAEQKAASLPPKLTVPMILFFLPALFIIILGPAGIQAGQAGLGGG